CGFALSAKPQAARPFPSSVNSGRGCPMRLLRLFLAGALVLGFAAASQAAPLGTKAVPSKKKHPGHTVKGVVVEVVHDKKKGHGEIKIKVHHKAQPKTKSKSAAAAATKKKTPADHVVTV